MSESNQGVKRHIPLRAKLLFALCIVLPLIPFSSWIYLLTTLCNNPRTPDPETHHVNAYSCHGMTVYISDLENAMLNWIIPIGGIIFILLGILAGVAAVVSMVSVRVKVNVEELDAPRSDSDHGEH